MNNKVKIGVILAIICLAVIFVLVLTMPPSGVSIQSSWTDNTVFGSGTLHFEGTVVNHYNATVHSVRLQLWLYDPNNHMIKIETVELGDMIGQSSKNVSLDIQHSSFDGVGRVDKTLTWNP